MFDHIKQTESNTCMACVMAMIVGETEKYVLDWFEHIDPPFYDEDAMIFLAHHGFFLAMGLFISPEIKLTNKVMDDIGVSVSFTGRPAFVIVQSPKTEGVVHAVLWDGKDVLDPLFDEKRNIEDYVVDTIFPITMSRRRYNKLMEESVEV